MTKTAEKPFPLGPHIPIYIAGALYEHCKGTIYLQFSDFCEVLEMCRFIFFDNERVVVIKQSIMVCQWKSNAIFH